MTAWRRARWWASDYAYAVKRQARSAFSRSDADSLTSGGLAPVLVIPGIYESWKLLAPLVHKVHSAGHPGYVVPELQLNVSPIVESGERVIAYLERHDLDG